MKNVFAGFIMICFTAQSFAQSGNANSKVVTSAEPSYPGGDQNLYSLVWMDLKYSKAAIDASQKGEITLSFDVKADSTVSNIVLISGVGYGTDESLIELLKKLKFAPGIQNARPVKMNTIYSFPVNAH
jgi:protein TonB